MALASLCINMFCLGALAFAALAIFVSYSLGGNPANADIVLITKTERVETLLAKYKNEIGGDMEVLVVFFWMAN